MSSTPENITELKPNEVFVFGSNLKGEHYSGAAQTAYELFGAAWDIGEGLVGQSYAFPTLYTPGGGYRDTQRSLEGLEGSRNALYRTAEALPALTFYLTRVGTGIAGFPEWTMKALFADAPKNIVKPEGW